MKDMDVNEGRHYYQVLVAVSLLTYLIFIQLHIWRYSIMITLCQTIIVITMAILFFSW